ncbi:rhodanese-like domain-containing protein [Malikia granosa]|uniref:Rhodanese-like domain-containing protein n=1 Tax=Malikia granosa TaxID=263067 RepID=A0A2S9K629_9BURK|nr:rhodanese-like domain-containing protein [Malikia granosa]PRD65916.1 rhodanese-like domain-containing protein [Malikia granosa]
MNYLKEYWPLLVVAAWFGYKWWRARRVTAMLPRLLEQGATLVDVRTVAEFAHASAPGTFNIPLQELAARLDEIPRAKPVVLGCASGTRSGMASLLLKKNGYAQVYNIGVWRNFLRHGPGA